MNDCGNGIVMMSDWIVCCSFFALFRRDLHFHVFYHSFHSNVFSFSSFSFSFSFFFFFFIMSFQQQQEDLGISPVIEAKSLLSNGDEAGAFAVLKKGAESGDVMACYDVGFMMIQGIGCDVDWEDGFEFMSKGSKLEEESPDMSWELCGSATELIEPQSMFIGGLLF